MTKLLQLAMDKVSELSESQQDSIAQIILKEIDSFDQVDWWDEFDQILFDCQVSTKIADLSYQHDHYLHGTPKRDD